MAPLVRPLRGLDQPPFMGYEVNKAISSIALALALAAQAASAADVEGSVSARWEDAEPTSATISGLGTSTVQWGVPVAPSAASSLSFSGGAFASAFEAPFKLGTLVYNNGTIANDTGAESVSLHVDVNFSSLALGVVTNHFAFQLENTPNVGDERQAADYVWLPDNFGETSFTVDGTEYHVRITGFDNVVGDGFLTSDNSLFHVKEGGMAQADLYASVTTLAPVPEPESYALLFAGLGLIGLKVRRRA
jgi:hypothetical protein